MRIGIDIDNVISNFDEVLEKEFLIHDKDLRDTGIVDENLYITEGMFNLGELEAYIRENGYNLDNIGFILIGISGLILIYLLICKYINRKIY